MLATTNTAPARCHRSAWPDCAPGEDIRVGGSRSPPTRRGPCPPWLDVLCQCRQGKSLLIAGRGNYSIRARPLLSCSGKWKTVQLTCREAGRRGLPKRPVDVAAAPSTQHPAPAVQSRPVPSVRLTCAGDPQINLTHPQRSRRRSSLHLVSAWGSLSVAAAPFAPRALSQPCWTRPSPPGARSSVAEHMQRARIHGQEISPLCRGRFLRILALGSAAPAALDWAGRAVGDRDQRSAGPDGTLDGPAATAVGVGALGRREPDTKGLLGHY